MAFTPSEQKRIIAEQIREQLRTLPAATHSPLIDYDALVNELSNSLKLLSKLKAFIQFLSKLNPSQYLEWMHKAFSNVVVSEVKNISDKNAGEQNLDFEQNAYTYTLDEKQAPGNDVKRPKKKS
ncbi:MAG: hypothetical protein JSS07_00270 [Proteobacteria bacterium]|nr:hypothetical protein [Pseudomonadota bacterium]